MNVLIFKDTSLCYFGVCHTHNKQCEAYWGPGTNDNCGNKLKSYRTVKWHYMHVWFFRQICWIDRFLYFIIKVCSEGLSYIASLDGFFSEMCHKNLNVLSISRGYCKLLGEKKYMACAKK